LTTGIKCSNFTFKSSNIIAMKWVNFKGSIFLVSFLFILNNLASGQTQVDFSSIPKAGTILINCHQDDDVLWMLPFWNKTEKFILGCMPTTPIYRQLIHEQQVYMDNNGYQIKYENNWKTPWPDVTDREYTEYYFGLNPAFNYLLNDHLEARGPSNLEPPLSVHEINKLKAKLEQYIASPTVSRIITDNNWGEYGNVTHLALNRALRELAVKYRKDIWILGSDNYAWIDAEIPEGITYTTTSFDTVLFKNIRTIYQNHSYWTWDNSLPRGNHNFLKIVDAGVDKSDILRGDSITFSGPTQKLPGAYIFDGINDYMTLPGNDYASFTIALRINPNQLKAMDIAKMSEYPTSTPFDRSIYLNSDGKLSARIFDGSNKIVTSQTYLPCNGNTWSHIAISGDGSSLKIYINGILENSVSTGTAITNYITPEFILGQAQETSSFFDGQIADVKLYDYELSSNEIAILNSTSSPVEDTIYASVGTGGSISPSGAQVVIQGGSRSFSISPSIGYQISDVLVDNVSVGAVASYTFSNIIQNHTISARFAALPSVALNRPSTAQSYEYSTEPSKANDEDGTNNSYWGASPNPQWWEVDLGDVYDLSGIILRNYVNGYRYYQYYIEASIDNQTFTQILAKTNTNLAIDAGDTYSLNSTARYLRVTVTNNSQNSGAHITDFKAFGIVNPNYFKITSIQSTGGTVNPSDQVSVFNGSDYTFTITPRIGFVISNVLIDNVSVGASSSYTFHNIISNHTIAATFTALPSIALNKPATAQSYESSTVSPSMANDADGTNNSFWGAEPNPQWWKVDLQGVYDITGLVLRNYFDGYRYYQYTIEASLDDQTYTQIVSKTNTNIATDLGDSYALYTTARYLRVNITNNSGNIGAHISDFRVYGTFNPNYHIITVNSNIGGIISPSGLTTVSNGTDQSYNITSNLGYQIRNVVVDGDSVGAVTNYTFRNVVSDHSIVAVFSQAPSIALNKPATAQSYIGAGFEPSRANDADASDNNFWAAEPNPQWWEVDLGDVYDISGIIIRNYVDGTRYYQYNIQESIDGQEFTQIISKTNTNVATTSGDSYPVSTTARFLRVNVLFNSHATRAHITDFKVFGARNLNYHMITTNAGVGGSISPSDQVSVLNGTDHMFTITPTYGYIISDVLLDNVSLGSVSSYTLHNITANHTLAATFAPLPSLALNKPATAQSYEYSGEAPSMANDADATNSSLWSGVPYPQWWKVDLGDTYDLTAIVIRNFVDGVRYYQYNIEASTDDQTYTQIISKTNTNIAVDGGDGYPVNTTARYLKVTITLNSFNTGAHISDFRVYGKYRITASAGTGGTISPSGVTSVKYNSNQAYSITANTGYQISDVTVDGVSVGAVSTYSFNNVTANHTISATFIQVHTITTIVGSGGTITPEGVVTVNHGSNQSFTIAAINGYKIAAVKVDNVSVGAVSSYTFTNVIADHTISATFISLSPSNLALNKPTTCQSSQAGHESSYANDADGSNNSYWSSSPYSKWWKVDLEAIYDLTSIVIRNYVEGSRSYQYTIQVSTDDVTYTQIAAKVNRNAAADAGDTYNINTTARYIRVNMTYNSTNMSVNISDFRVYGTPAVGLPTYSLTSTAGSNGYISPSGTVIVNRGTKQTFTIAPNSGYKVSNVIVDGTSVGALSSYIFNYVTANHDISATFSELTTYTITSSVSGGGTINPSGTTVINQGASQTYSIVPNEGYAIGQVYVDGNVVGPVTTYTFSNVTGGHTIFVSFLPVHQIFAFVPNVDEGTISPADITMVKDGDSQTYTITPSTGYAIDQVYIDGNTVGPVTTYTFSNVTEDHTIFAYFVPLHQIFAFVPNVDEGTISPADVTMVKDGGSQSYTITPSTGYAIDQVYVDGNAVGTVTSYTFNNVTEDHNIFALFLLNSGGGSKGSSSNNLKVTDKKLVNSVSETVFEDLELNVFPNPFVDEIKVSINSSSEGLFNLSIIDMGGRTVYLNTKIESNTENAISLNLPSGVYILKISNNESGKAIRIVKY
jgi:hypothetical protein